MCVGVPSCAVRTRAVYSVCTRHSNAKHESLDLMSMISWRWNLFICIKIPQPLWSINATRLLSVAVIFINWPYAHEKLEKKQKKKICRSSWGWNPSCFILKEAPWPLLGWEWFFGFCSARSCWFTATLSVSHLSSREEIINLSELLLTQDCVSVVDTHTHTQAFKHTGANICSMHAHMCMQAHNVCTLS